MRDDGTYVATGPMPGEASLTVSAIPGATSNEPDGAGYMFQLAAVGWLQAIREHGIQQITADLLPLNLEKRCSTNPG